MNRAARTHKTGTGTPPDCGLYVLVVRLTAPVHLRVGALGSFACAAGWYLYVGSARRNLRARVSRHLLREKRLRWHIDYLSSAAAARPLGAVLLPAPELTECALNRAVGRRCGNPPPIPGFGASDCRAGCAAHLWFSHRPIALSSLAELQSGALVVLAPPGGEPPRTSLRDRASR